MPHEPAEFPLTKIEPPDARDLFAGDGVDRMVQYIATCAEAATAGTDIKTKKGQDAIRSAAANVSKSKVVLDKAGKALVDDLRAQVSIYTEQIDAINAGRKRLAEQCDKLRDATRKPLTDWEQAEAKRIADLEADLKAMEELGRVGPQHTVDQIRSAQAMLDTFHDPDLTWDEFANKAEEVYQDSKKALETALKARLEADANAAELAKVKAELEERRRAEAARLAEEKRQAELKAAADQARAEAEAEAARKIAAADERARREANAREQAAAQAIRDAEERAERAEAEKEAAVQAERQRVEADRAAEAKRAANKKHRENVHGEIVDAIDQIARESIGDHNDGPDLAEMTARIVAAIAAGKIPHLTITY